MPDSLVSWLEHIERIHPKTIAMGLDRLEKVKENMGLHPPFPIVTVGGTNGKGSTCAMLESILRHAGYKVGCYTSPHLVRFNERIRIRGAEAADEEIAFAFSIVEKGRGEVPLTYFEFSTLAAMELFIEREVDVAILEVGLGGRLDAVNLFDADCAVITGIDYDHMDYLGDTREKIGFEKSGILRHGKFGVCSDPDVPGSVLLHAQEIGAKLLRIGPDFGFVRHQNSWDYRGREGERRNLPYPSLKGEFQLHNACAALAALDCLELRLEENAIREGLTDLELPGRFQVLPGKPTTILDVAHNPQAARMLAKNLSGQLSTGRTVAVFGMLSDKDIEGVVDALRGEIDEWLIFPLDVPRGAGIERLKAAFRDTDRVLAFPAFARAWAHACASVSENDRIAVFGSFYTVSDFMRLCPRSLRA